MKHINYQYIPESNIIIFESAEDLNRVESIYNITRDIELYGVDKPGNIEGKKNNVLKFSDNVTHQRESDELKIKQHGTKAEEKSHGNEGVLEEGKVEEVVEKAKEMAVKLKDEVLEIEKKEHKKSSKKE